MQKIFSKVFPQIRMRISAVYECAVYVSYTCIRIGMGLNCTALSTNQALEEHAQKQLRISLHCMPFSWNVLFINWCRG